MQISTMMSARRGLKSSCPTCPEHPTNPIRSRAQTGRRAHASTQAWLAHQVGVCRNVTAQVIIFRLELCTCACHLPDRRAESDILPAHARYALLCGLPCRLSGKDKYPPFRRCVSPTPSGG